MIFSSNRTASQSLYKPAEIDIRTSSEFGGMGLFANADFAENTIVHHSNGEDCGTRPVPFSVEIEDGTHIHDPLLAFLNHSENPNAHFDKSARALIALRKIKAGDELTICTHKLKMH